MPRSSKILGAEIRRAPAAAFRRALLVAAVFAAASAALSAAAPRTASDEETAARIVGAALLNSRAYDTVAYLTDRIGSRLSGSPGLDRAIAWTEKRFRENGADRVATEPVQVPHWVRGIETGRIAAPVDTALYVTALGGSVATPEGGLSGEVVEFPGLDELRQAGETVAGKIVLLNRDMTRDGGSMSGYGAVSSLRRDGAVETAKLGGIAVLVRSLGTAAYQLPHTGAMHYADGVPQIPAAALSEESADLIHRLLAAGDPVRVELKLGCRTLPDAPSANVVADLRGRERPDEIVLIGAHLDSWDLGPGALDDGAGVAIVMETMRLLKSLHLSPRRTIRAVLFTNEENGLRGGRGYAEHHRDELPRHVAAVEADSGAGRPLGFSFGAGAGPSAEAALRSIAGYLAPLGAGEVTAGGGGADISALRFAGVPQVGLHQDTSAYFDYHHTAADTLDKIDRRELDRNVAALAVMAYFLAERAEPLPRYVPTPDERKEEAERVRQRAQESTSTSKP